MAAPNIVSVSSIYGKTLGVGLGTDSTTGILTCSADKVLKINSVLTSLASTSPSTKVTVSFYDSSASNSYEIANIMTLPAGSTLVVIGKDSPIYLEESDEIRAGISTSDVSANIIISYEEIDDA